MNKFVFLDTETGGLDDESLLSLSLIVTDDHFIIKDQLYLAVKPDDGKYLVSAGGLAVNRINLVEHDHEAVTYKEAGTRVYNFINFHLHLTEPLHEHLIPAGWGVDGDVRRVCRFLMKRATWESCCSYRQLEVGAVARFLQLAGVIPRLQNGSLVGICKHFDIPINAHHAEGDNLASIEVLKRLFKAHYDWGVQPKLAGPLGMP